MYQYVLPTLRQLKPGIHKITTNTSPSSNMRALSRLTLFASAAHALSSTATHPAIAGNPAAQSLQIPASNLEAIDQLEPGSVWTQFAILSSIPRPSKQEQAVLQYIQDFAASHNLQWKQDAVGNLVVFHPGCGKFGQKAAPVIVQGHLDMVTEKNSDTRHDFETDPILLQRQSNGWLTATDTTLGADNGIGVATALALLELSPSADNNDIQMPPLQALFTVDEETGLTGAFELDAQTLGLTGKTLLNLDTEEWGDLYVGCAGGGESIIKLPLERTDLDDSNDTQLMELRVEGLLGGHSGINIHEGRGNAILLCAGVCQALLEANDGVRLVRMEGGDKHNAIPREARAILTLSSTDDISALEAIVHAKLKAAQEEYGTLEEKLQISLGKAGEIDSCPRPLSKQSSTKLLATLLSLPHGPLKFSHAMPDLVETSNNVASLTITEDEANILCSTRSSIATALEGTRQKLKAIADLAGASVEQSPSYPGWNPNLESAVLRLATRLLEERMPKPPGIKAIHAGLECGLLMEKMRPIQVDALSFGPTITGAHSPDESLKIDTVEPFYQLVQDMLTELAMVPAEEGKEQ